MEDLLSKIYDKVAFYEEITKTKNGDSKQQTFAQLTVEQTGIIAND